MSTFTEAQNWNWCNVTRTGVHQFTLESWEIKKYKHRGCVKKGCNNPIEYGYVNIPLSGLAGGFCVTCSEHQSVGYETSGN